MQPNDLFEQFRIRARSAALPFVLDDEVEVLEGVYKGRRGVVETLAYTETPIRYLIDFRDGTDELFLAGALKLHDPDCLTNAEIDKGTSQFLSGRTTVGIERVGDTVRRPTGAHSAFVHALLLHLERRGFDGAPMYLGIDNAGREILSYVPGDVPADLGVFSNEQLAGAAHLLRALHDATLDFPDRDESEIACHGDASPCNCVFRDARPIAFIDFDAAHAGSRWQDVAYASWLWLDLGDKDLDPVAQGRRLYGFITAYGGLDPNDAVSRVLEAQTELSQRPAAPIGTREWARRCLDWTTANRVQLESGLALAPRHPNFESL